MKVRLTEEIWKEGNMYVSYCPELDIASCGEDVQQAKKNLMEAISINIEETKVQGSASLCNQKQYAYNRYEQKKYFELLEKV